MLAQVAGENAGKQAHPGELLAEIVVQILPELALLAFADFQELAFQKLLVLHLLAQLRVGLLQLRRPLLDPGIELFLGLMESPLRLLELGHFMDDRQRRPTPVHLSRAGGDLGENRGAILL